MDESSIRILIGCPEWKIFEELAKVRREVWLHKLKLCKKEDSALKLAGVVAGFDDLLTLPHTLLAKMKKVVEKEGKENEEVVY